MDSYYIFSKLLILILPLLIPQEFSGRAILMQIQGCSKSLAKLIISKLSSMSLSEEPYIIKS